MEMFAVVKPGGMKANEYEAYKRILEQGLIDVADCPRIPEPETHRRWLYAWPGKSNAEAFARELKYKTQDGSWQVYQSQVDEGSHGPVAPLDIHEIREPHESEFYLGGKSRVRVERAFPVPILFPVTLSQAQIKQLQKQHGEAWWDQVCAMVTHLSLEQVLSLGGYRMIVPFNEIAREVLPPISN